MATAEAPPPVRPREIVAWAMFDFANSSYTTLIVTVAFSVYFTKLVAPGDRADLLWGLGISISNFIAVVAGPVLGAMADGMGRKKHFLFGTYLLCVLGTLSLYFVLPGRVDLALFLFVASNVGFALGENLTASFLPELSTPETVGRISGFGWGLGYLGGLACLGVCWKLLAGGFNLENLDGLRWTWVATGLFFLVSAIPTFLILRERAPRGPARSVGIYFVESFGRLWTTARSLRHFRTLALFLAVFFVFSCGLMTIIAFASVYAERTVGFTAKDLIFLFIALQLTSALGAVAFGFIQDRLGARRTIQCTLLLWIVISVGAYLAASKSVFWVVALVAGLGIGSLQSASRGLVGLFSPVDKSAEFFGFWGFAGKLAYMTGPFLFGVVSAASGSQRIAILANVVFFILGLVGMFLIDESRGRRAVEAWEAAHGSASAHG